MKYKNERYGGKLYNVRIRIKLSFSVDKDLAGMVVAVIFAMLLFQLVIELLESSKSEGRLASADGESGPSFFNAHLLKIINRKSTLPSMLLMDITLISHIVVLVFLPTRCLHAVFEHLSELLDKVAFTSFCECSSNLLHSLVSCLELARILDVLQKIGVLFFQFSLFLFHGCDFLLN